jgi:hypothetical protein
LVGIMLWNLRHPAYDSAGALAGGEVDQGNCSLSLSNALGIARPSLFLSGHELLRESGGSHLRREPSAEIPLGGQRDRESATDNRIGLLQGLPYLAIRFQPVE